MEKKTVSEYTPHLSLLLLALSSYVQTKMLYSSPTHPSTAPPRNNWVDNFASSTQQATQPVTSSGSSPKFVRYAIRIHLYNCYFINFFPILFFSSLFFLFLEMV